ncbi:hypothetical protein [Luteimonas sp. 3794]|uniref:hypothetical protein n=1 Tax=Luteimonas sp. 3794 TaxID=2817730 RepID=UPI002864DF33|nr:hypothetical protein [Luteimonas sp. 3794]MDR6992498.1 hypothetical protein [Luteimonas sp. 3794]
MITPRTLWRVLVMPTYILIAGAVFALALRNTAGSILSPLAPFAPWAIVMAAALALLSIAGVILRWRRRLRAVRRVHAASHARVGAEWHDSDQSSVVQHAGRG